MQTQVHGGDIYSLPCRIDFSTNINPLGTPRSVILAAKEGCEMAAHYPDVRCRELRAAIGDFYRFPQEWISCGNGAAELIFAVCQALRPHSALLATPCFSEYEQALRVSGCRDIRYYMCSKQNNFRMREDILEHITSDLDIFFLCNPANPTGILVDHDLCVRIADRCRQEKVVLVVDECFNGLLEYPERNTLRGELPENPSLLILNAFTKTFAIPGLRLGFAMSSNRQLLERMESCLQPWNVSIPAQKAGVAALKETAFLSRTGSYIARERQFLEIGLERLSLTYYDSYVNFIFFEGPKDLFDRCREQGILIRDCSNYRSLKPGYFRVAVRTRDDNQELLGVLDNILKGRSPRDSERRYHM